MEKSSVRGREKEGHGYRSYASATLRLLGSHSQDGFIGGFRLNMVVFALGLRNWFALEV